MKACMLAGRLVDWRRFVVAPIRRLWGRCGRIRCGGQGSMFCPQNVSMGSCMVTWWKTHLPLAALALERQEI